MKEIKKPADKKANRLSARGRIRLQNDFFCFFISSLLYLLVSFTSCIPKKNYVEAKDEVKWYALLPACPCENPDKDSVKTSDGWARERNRNEMGFLQRLFAGRKGFSYYHPGAVTSFRSYPYTATVINGKKFKSGQQCTYDEKGKLMPSGEGAGTPDKFSPAKGENNMGLLTINIFRVIRHRKYDSSPWKKQEWKEYHKFWPPDKGRNCE